MHISEVEKYRREKEHKMRYGYDRSPQEMKESGSGRNSEGESLFNRNKLDDDNMPKVHAESSDPMPQTDEPTYQEGNNLYHV